MFKQQHGWPSLPGKTLAYMTWQSWTKHRATLPGICSNGLGTSLRYTAWKWAVTHLVLLNSLFCLCEFLSWWNNTETCSGEVGRGSAMRTVNNSLLQCFLSNFPRGFGMPSKSLLFIPNSLWIDLDLSLTTWRFSQSSRWRKAPMHLTGKHHLNFTDYNSGSSNPVLIESPFQFHKSKK